tara:strand:+ start:432 stop:614 length:183 start_codon:yes stop_codon:yes gene_type:complete
VNKERIKVIKEDTERWFEREVQRRVEEGYVPRFETYRVVSKRPAGTLVYSILMELKDEEI